VGRDRELAALAAALADARAGRRGVLLVEGAPGMGKTTLLRAGLRSAEPSLVLWASGDETERDVDHGVIDQLVRAAPLSPADRAELRGAMGPDPLQTGAAIVALVDRLELARDRPVVVAVDDAQWADEASLRALTFAARRLRRDPLLLVVAVRSASVDDLPAGLVRLVDDQGARLQVAPLDREDVRRLVEVRAGETISGRNAERLRAHTEGSPLHLVTLLDELPLATITAAGELPSPRSFSTLVLARLAGAGPEVEALVTALAVLGEATSLEVAAEVAGLHAPLAALDRSVERGFLEVTRGSEADGLSITFVHPLVRAAVLGDLPLARRAELHRRAADVLGGSAGLRHRLLGTERCDGEVWSLVLDAAAGHAAAGSHGAAAWLLQQATRIAPTDEARERSVLEAVQQLLLAGRLAEAAALRPDVDAAASSPRRSFVRGQLAYVLGPRRDARAHLTEAWAALVDAAGSEPALLEQPEAHRQMAGQVAAMRAINCVDRAAGDEAVRWCRWALALDPQHAALASTAHMLAGAHALTSKLDEGLAELDALCAAAAEGPGPAIVDAHSGRGLLRLWSHDLSGAAADLLTSLEAAGRAGSFAARESARFYLAEVRYRQGRWDEAVQLAQAAASVADDGEQTWLAAIPHATAARPLAARGVDAAREHLERALLVAEQVGTGVSRVLAQVSAVEVAACARDHTTVVALGDVLIEQAVDERLAPWRASYVEALVAVGRIEDAVVAAGHGPRPDASPLALTDAARSAVVVAAAVGEAAEVDAAAAAALDLDPDDVGPYPRARLELVVGRAWRRRGSVGGLPPCWRPRSGASRPLAPPRGASRSSRS
jgi:tetratricopeptide (TPR) repeat protein